MNYNSLNFSRKMSKSCPKTDYFESSRNEKYLKGKFREKEEIEQVTNCHDVIKLYVKGQNEESCQKFDCSSSLAQTSETSQSEEETTKCFSCWRKPMKKIQVDAGIQTCPALLNNAKTQSSEIDINDKNLTRNERYNSFIFKDKSGGDGLLLLENWLKLEAKANSRQMEDVLSELQKQRRDIQDLKEMLETVVKAVREQFFMSAFGKGKAEFLQDLTRQNNLERKSNTLSITKSSESEEVAKAHVLEDFPDRKRKRFFPWCI